MIPITRASLALTRKTNSTTIHRILSRHVNTMATSRKILITPENTGLWHPKQTEAAANKTSELLQQDLDVGVLIIPISDQVFQLTFCCFFFLQNHHCFFNNSGYHNQ